MTPDEMDEMIEILISRGLSPELAEDYAARIGDTPEEAPDGRWIIRDDAGNVVAVIDPLL